MVLCQAKTPRVVPGFFEEMDQASGLGETGFAVDLASAQDSF